MWAQPTPLPRLQLTWALSGRPWNWGSRAFLRGPGVTSIVLGSRLPLSTSSQVTHPNLLLVRKNSPRDSWRGQGSDQQPGDHASQCPVLPDPDSIQLLLGTQGALCARKNPARAWPARPVSWWPPVSTRWVTRTGRLGTGCSASGLGGSLPAALLHLLSALLGRGMCPFGPRSSDTRARVWRWASPPTVPREHRAVGLSPGSLARGPIPMLRRVAASSLVPGAGQGSH